MTDSDRNNVEEALRLSYKLRGKEWAASSRHRTCTDDGWMFELFIPDARWYCVSGFVIMWRAIRLLFKAIEGRF